MKPKDVLCVSVSASQKGDTRPWNWKANQSAERPTACRICRRSWGRPKWMAAPATSWIAAPACACLSRSATSARAWCKSGRKAGALDRLLCFALLGFTLHCFAALVCFESFCLPAFALFACGWPIGERCCAGMAIRNCHLWPRSPA